jgi:hypothetical protein
MLYRISRWLVVLGAGLCLVSEAGSYIALLLCALLWLIADWRQYQMTPLKAWNQFVHALRNRAWWAWFVLAVTIWIVEGLLAAYIQGNVPRVSHLYKAFFVLTAVVGYRVLPSFSRLFWRRLIVGALLGAGVAATAGLLQYKKSSFPMERMLMSEAEKTEKGHYRGQLYIPGTRMKAVTGPLRNRIKTSVTLVWLFALLAGLSQLTKTFATRLGLALTAGILGCFSFYTFAKAGIGVSVLCLFGVMILHFAPCFRGLIYGVLAAAFVVGMTFVITTGVSYEPNVKAPIATDKVSVRGFAWSHGFQVVQEYPLLGAGLGTYSRSSRDFFLDPELARSYTINSHCQHLTAWAEGGIIGVMAWILMIALIAGAIQRSWLVEAEGVDSAFRAKRLATTFALVAAFLLSFVHDFLFHPSVAALFWMMVGLAGYLALNLKSEEAMPVQSVSSTPVATI